MGHDSGGHDLHRQLAVHQVVGNQRGPDGDRVQEVRQGHQDARQRGYLVNLNL